MAAEPDGADTADSAVRAAVDSLVGPVAAHPELPRPARVPALPTGGVRSSPARGAAHRPALGVRSSPAYTAMVVDGSASARAATAQRLRTLGAYDVVEATGLTQARACARLSGPRDIGVLELRLGDDSGLELLVDLHALGWERLVVLSDVDDLVAVRSAFLAGAQGYLLKSAPEAIVVSGLRRVLEGGLYADPAVACPLPPLRTAADGGPAHELSAREVEVLQLVADGHTNKQIGTDLGLSALTVKSHLARMGRKLGTGDRAEMVAHGMRAGVIR